MAATIERQVVRANDYSALQYGGSDNSRVLITVAQWCEAGLSYNVFKNDSKRGFLKIEKRGLNGETLIDVSSIVKRDRVIKIEKYLNRRLTTECEAARRIYAVEMDERAREWFICYRTPMGEPLTADRISDYVARASLMKALCDGMQRQISARAQLGQRLRMSEFWTERLKWHTEASMQLLHEGRDVPVYSNERSLERAFKAYINDGYESIVHKNVGNDSAKKVSARIEKLLLALWRMNGKPFIEDVHQLYTQFIHGTTTLFDRETGELYNPKDFVYRTKKGDVEKSLDISRGTVWNYLKDVVAQTAIYRDRNGYFDYVNGQRPKVHRKLGRYSLSKVSMDDRDMSFQSHDGWVHSYVAVDAVSGYWFRPAYALKKDLNLVMEAFRNMFIELSMLGLPIPGEIEVEHFLMKDIEWLNEVFPFVRFCTSATEKRAEHKIRGLKWGVSHKKRHMKGRWFAKHEAYRSIRYKKDGDFVEPKYDYREIVANDLSDIEKHNNTLHPLERTFGRKTRRQIMMDNFNPACPKLERSYMWRYVGNEAADINIYNHDYVKCANAEFELADYESLRRLRPGNRKVSAYWLPEDDGRVDRVYLYQGDTYIGEAVDRRQTDFNENQIEQTAEDAEKKLHQFKRLSKFDRMIREERTEIPRVEVWEDPASSQPPLHRREEEEKACKDLFLKDPADKTADYTDDFDMDDYEQKAIMVM